MKQETHPRPPRAGVDGEAAGSGPVGPLPYPQAVRVTVPGPHPDPYRWLEDPSTAATAEWVRAQDALAAAFLTRLPDHSGWRERVSRTTAVDSVSVPRWRGARSFSVRQLRDDDRETLWVRDPDDLPRLLVDPRDLGDDGSLLDSWEPSPDGRRLACRIAGADEEGTLFVLDVESGRILDGPIDRCRRGALTWLPDSNSFYYVRHRRATAETAGPSSLYRVVHHHVVGADADDDPEVFRPEDPGTTLSLAVSAQGRWLAVTARRGTERRTRIRLFSIAADPAAPRPVCTLPGGEGAYTRAWFVREQLCLFTDHDAPGGRLCTVDPQTPEAPWRTIIAEIPGEKLTHVAVLGDGRVMTCHLYEARSRLRWFDSAGTFLTEVGTPGAGTVLTMVRRSYDDSVWLGYTAFGTPPTVLVAEAGESTLRPWPGASGAQRPTEFVVRDAWYGSADGTPVHAFVCEPHGAQGPLPTVLSAYGGFGVPLTPGYQPAVTAWVEAGGRYVIANVRGGGEFGETWHRDGMRGRKEHSFEDFLAVSQGLIDEGLCAPESLAIAGASNGGLLVGVALTRRPELYAAVSCVAPLLDMVRYDRFGLGRLWTHEYGRPDRPEELAWLTAYSPYHHVVEGTRYPAVLLVTFDEDSRVDPLHARKMCAALQWAGRGPSPVVLLRHPRAGHGNRTVPDMISHTAAELAFLAHHTGLRLGNGQGRPGHR